VEAVGDGDDGAVLQDGGEGAFGVAGGGGVEEGGRLVEDEGVGVGEDDPREGELLGLGAVQHR